MTDQEEKTPESVEPADAAVSATPEPAAVEPVASAEPAEPAGAPAPNGAPAVEPAGAPASDSAPAVEPAAESAAAESEPEPDAAKPKRTGVIVGGVVLVVALAAVAYFALAPSGAAVSSSAASEAPSFSTRGDSGDEQTKEAATEVARVEFDMLKNADPEAVGIISAIATSSFYELTGLSIDECGINGQTYASRMLKGFDYEIITTVADEASGGYVAATVTCRDVADVLSIFAESRDALVASEEYATMTEDEAKNCIGQLLLDAVDAAKFNRSGYFSVSVVYEDDAWEVDFDSWEEQLSRYFSLAN